jgi:hypothetical protein
VFALKKKRPSRQNYHHSQQGVEGLEDVSARTPLGIVDKQLFVKENVDSNEKSFCHHWSGVAVLHDRRSLELSSV